MRNCKRIIKTLFVVLLSFILIRILFFSTRYSQTNELISVNPFNTKTDYISENMVAAIKSPMNLSDSLEKLYSLICKINFRSNQFPNIHPKLVLIIQIHNRISYFYQLISSLSRNADIQDTLIIVSSDYFNDEIYRFIMNITFTTVLPIYYPYSIQLYPNTFPGNDPKDCPKKASYEEARKLGCNNAACPDQYGNYREAKYTAIKHHWFWKIATVFDKFHPLNSYNGYVFFLEEDHYVFPDFITSALQLITLHERSCSDCSFINLGTYKSDNAYQQYSHLAQIHEWAAGEHNMGFGMNRNVWNQIRDCSNFFCNFDDYNWDWTLQAVGLRCLKSNFKVLVMLCPRIVHLGNCGIHHTNLGCDPINSAKQLQDKIIKEYVNLFPQSIELLHSEKVVKQAFMPNPYGFGGWGDERDRKLCLRYITESFRTNTSYRLQR